MSAKPRDFPSRPRLAKRGTVSELSRWSLLSVHVADLGMASASDAEIVEHALLNHFTIVTLDADFHSLVSLSGKAKPSVIRVRVEGLKSEPLAILISDIYRDHSEAMTSGCLISVTAKKVAVRKLPITSLSPVT